MKVRLASIVFATVPGCITVLNVPANTLYYRAKPIYVIVLWKLRQLLCAISVSLLLQKTNYHCLKRFFTITTRIILIFIAFLLFLWLMIQTVPVQNWIVGKITKRLSNDLQTEVKIRHVSFVFFNSMNLEGTLVKDQRKDTLLYADQIKLRITDWFFLKDELVLKYVGLEDAQVNMHRQDSVWNYQFLIDHFAPKKPGAKKSTLKFNLRKLDFKNVSFVKNDAWVGNLLEAKVANMQLEANNFNLDSSIVDINQMDLDRPYFSLKDFKGLRPPVTKEKKLRRLLSNVF